MAAPNGAFDPFGDGIGSSSFAIQPSAAAGNSGFDPFNELAAPPPKQAASPFDSFGQSAPQRPQPANPAPNQPNFDPFGGLNSAASGHTSGSNSGSNSNFNPFDTPAPSSLNHQPAQQSAPSPWDSLSSNASATSSSNGFGGDFSNSFANSNNGASSAAPPLTPAAAVMIDPFASQATPTQVPTTVPSSSDPWALSSVDPWGETSMPAAQPAQVPHVPAQVATPAPAAPADPFGASAPADPFSSAPSAQLPASWLDSSSSLAAPPPPPPAPTTATSSDFDALFGSASSAPPPSPVVVVGTPVAHAQPPPVAKVELPPDSGITHLVQSVDEMDIWGNNSSTGASASSSSGASPPREATAAATTSSRSTDEDDGHDQLELQSGVSGETYEVVFPYEDKLGMLLEKCDETDPKKGGKVERTMVKMVIEGGAAEMRGVQLGSKVVSLNGRNAVGMAYQETLNLVKKLPRPLTVVLEQVAAFRDAAQGVCYTRKDMGQGPPTSWEAWKPQYFVIGGAVAKPFVLQLYDSKRDYEEVVVNMFQGKSIAHLSFKAYKLNLSFACGPCATKHYNGGVNSMTYFWLKNPKSYFKVLKIGSENSAVTTALRIQITKFASQG